MRIRFALAVLIAALHTHAPLVGVAPSTPELGAQGLAAGIKVHGDWTIEVRRPDGTITTRREFKNALTEQGRWLIADLLGRRETMQYRYWGISVMPWTNMPEPSPCANALCVVSETIPLSGFELISNNLTVSNIGPTVVLSGSFTADRTGKIYEVAATVFDHCRDSSRCASMTRITATSPDDPIDVTAGQIVQMKVVISFS